MSDSLRPHGLHSPWNSPGQNTGVGGLSLLQGIFPTQGSNPGLLHCRQILCHLSHLGSLSSTCTNTKSLFLCFCPFLILILYHSLQFCELSIPSMLLLCLQLIKIDLGCLLSKNASGNFLEVQYKYAYYICCCILLFP